MTAPQGRQWSEKNQQQQKKPAIVQCPRHRSSFVFAPIVIKMSRKAYSKEFTLITFYYSHVHTVCLSEAT